MRQFRLISILISLLFAAGAAAQVTTLGEDPDSLHWKYRNTGNYKLIFPDLLRTTDVDYVGASLERYRPAVGRSVGMAPGQFQLGRVTPVILHSANIVSNGSVLWAPKRMDLYMIPEPFDPDPMPWLQQLAVHESRHVAQMQLGYRRPFRWMNYIVGEILPGALVGIYSDIALMEGDAVTAETGLTLGGRGRTADFLNYMQVAFAEKDWRNYYRWRYGSYKHYTPDYYKLGYLTIAGARALYDDPLFMQRFYNNICRHPFHIGNLKRTLKQDSGENLRRTFRDIQLYFADIWAEEQAARAPFIPAEQISRPKPRFPEFYEGLTATDDRVFAIKKSYVSSAKLVSYDPESGKEKTFGVFSGSTSDLSFDKASRRIYWSELRSDVRWELAGSSIIRYLDLADMSRHTLTKGTRYFNPTASEGELVVVEYPVDGGSAVVVLNPSSGQALRRLPSPDDRVQITEAVKLGDSYYALGLEEAGFAVWRHDGSWRRCSEPVIAKMHDLEAADGVLQFVSDRDGSNELYSFNPSTGETVRRTSLRFGGSDFAALGDKVYFNSMTRRGRGLFASPSDSLESEAVDMSTVHRYAVAEKLTQQEDSLALEAVPVDIPDGTGGDLRYSKGSHLLKIHSWAPLFFDYDEVASLSGDIYSEVAGLGATLLFQNDLGTSYGSIGYGATMTDGEWHHEGLLKYTYSGWWPVIETSFGIGGREHSQTGWRDITFRGAEYVSTTYGKDLTSPLVSASVRAYVPLNFSGGGIVRGLIPEVSYKVSNDLFRRDRVKMSYLGDGETLSVIPSFRGVEGGGYAPLQTLKASVRGYVMTGTGHSQVYPSFGIGSEIGASGFLGLGDFYSPTVYANVYGYLPGLLPEQGLRLSARAEDAVAFGSAVGRRSIPFTPRGWYDSADEYLARRYEFRARLSADYAIPLYLGDISFLSPVVYIKNFVLTPYIDYTLVGNFKDHPWTGLGAPAAKGFEKGLYTYGFEFTASIANFLFLPFDGAMGFRVEINGGGPLYDTLKEAGYVSPVSGELIFNVSI